METLNITITMKDKRKGSVKKTRTYTGTRAEIGTETGTSTEMIAKIVPGWDWNWEGDGDRDGG